MSGLPHDRNDLPTVTEHVDTGQIKQFVTRIKSAERQVGEHLIRALQEDDTVAVLTTVVVAPDGGQHIVSAGLDPGMLEQVKALLREAETERDEEVPCIGFHCFTKRKRKGDD